MRPSECIEASLSLSVIDFRYSDVLLNFRPVSSQCLVFEDAPNGVQAAVSAGMQVVMVPDSIVPPEKRTLATKVIDSLLEFKPEEFGLPAFENDQQ